jgi:excisionase family DNA binding protein
MDSRQFYSVKEVAQILGLSPDRIYEYLRTGHLKGSRLAKNSAWRIPTAELERLGASLLGRPDEKQVKTQSDRWSSLLDIAAQLQSSLSVIDPRHLGVYGVGHHSFGSTVIPQLKLRVWVERGRVQVNLLVEEDSRFPLFISQARGEFPQFNEFENWKDCLAELITICQSMRSEIKEGLEKGTGISRVLKKSA